MKIKFGVLCLYSFFVHACGLFLIVLVLLDALSYTCSSMCSPPALFFVLQSTSQLGEERWSAIPYYRFWPAKLAVAKPNRGISSDLSFPIFLYLLLSQPNQTVEFLWISRSLIFLYLYLLPSQPNQNAERSLPRIIHYPVLLKGRDKECFAIYLSLSRALTWSLFWPA